MARANNDDETSVMQLRTTNFHTIRHIRLLTEKLMISMSKSSLELVQTFYILFDTTAKIQRTLKDCSSHTLYIARVNFYKHHGIKTAT